MKIKKCPFCGSKAITCRQEYTLANGAKDEMFRVECIRPDCRNRTNYWSPEGAAIRAWNKRKHSS